ncbi:MAG: hypothetical protein ACRDJM_11635 [Actinomycetota bacterium]
MFNRPGWQATLALLFVAAGFVVLGLGWSGAASKNTVPEQFPYLLSGGFVGMGMIVVGVGLMLFESGRRAGTKVDTKIGELNALLQKMQVSTNGSSAESAIAEARVANGKVVIGARSFHRPDCRLVEGKEALVFAAASLATEQGLLPCRVCNPDAE